MDKKGQLYKLFYYYFFSPLNLLLSDDICSGLNTYFVKPIANKRIQTPATGC
jgi:hypothetical protein